MLHEFTCHVCGQHKTHESDFSTGYGSDENDNKICFDCCGKQDAERLKNLQGKEKMLLYWDGKNIINWPSTLKISPYYVAKGRHNIAGKREDIYFNFEGNKYHATQYGDMSQIAHVRKTK